MLPEAVFTRIQVLLASVPDPDQAAHYLERLRSENAPGFDRIANSSAALGYLITIRDPDTRAGRGYLWVMGPFLKGAGAATFLLDYFIRHSPASFLLFAASDGTLAVLTLWALLSAPRLRA